jgi:hypothetical protein
MDIVLSENRCQMCVFKISDVQLVLFKSLRNSKTYNKGNLTSKSNSNKIKLCLGGILF